MAHGKIIYYAADGTPTTYVFEENFDFDWDQGDLDAHDIARAPDGTLHSYAGAIKGRYSLPFEYVPASQLAAFQAAWRTGRAVDLYLDANQAAPTITGLIVESPKAKAKSAFVNGQHTYSFDLVIEEI
jgi:hypothetical protein